MRFRTTEIAEAVGGTVSGAEATIDGANHDSRLITPGQLFVPIVAERDGHHFIANAVSAGATAFFTDRGDTSGDAVAIGVEDTVGALASLGKLARSRIKNDVVGITGSVGKTTVKDLVRAVLGQSGNVHAAAASFNNEIGVPLTLIGAPDESHRVVVELGARGIGHIRYLCEIARPNVGVVTKVTLAHGEHFGTLDDIAEGKGELVEQLPRSGTAVLNADDQRVAAMVQRTGATVLTFGVTKGEVRATNVVVHDDLSIRFTLATPWGSVEVRPKVKGQHNAINAAAAASVGFALGLSLGQVAQGLGEAELSPLRMDIVRLTSGATVLDDTYNANPTSMKAALEALVRLPAKRHVAVLGIMAELGKDQKMLHEGIAKYASGMGVEVVTVAAPAYGAEEVGGRSFENVEEVLDYLGVLGAETALLAKGSRVAELDRLVRALRS